MRQNDLRQRLIALGLSLSMTLSLGLSSGGIAIAVDTDPDAGTFCGIPAHTHGDECYTTERTLICGVEEGAVHTHDESCYTTVDTLICGQEESEGHTHTEACYTTEETLICTNEDPEHVHDESCYESSSVLTCGLEETPGHTHTADCYRQKQVLTCTEEENVPHVHTDTCYQEESVLTCTKAEHTHTDACYSDPNADLESQSSWEAALSGLTYTGKYREDLLTVAKSQLGYAESTRNYQVNDDGSHNGYTRYGAWYGIPYGDWCAMFVSFCLHYAGITGMPMEASCPRMIEKIQKLEQTSGQSLYHTWDSGYWPEAGDLVFFYQSGDASHTASHVGIVSAADENGFDTIEGNAGPVGYHHYSYADNLNVLGFASLPEQDSLRTITDEQGIVSITGDLPEDVTATVTELPQETVDSLLYDGYEAVFAYDITLYQGETEYQPETPVQVQVFGTDAQDGVIIAHVELDENGEQTDGEFLTAAVDENGTVEFETSGFSAYLGVQAVNDWTVTSGSVTVAGTGAQPSTITVTTSSNRSNYTGDKFAVFGYDITSDITITSPVTITVEDCGIMSDDTSIEVWKVDGEQIEKLDTDVSVSEGKIEFQADALGEFLAVSDVATVDLSKGAVTVTTDGLQGKQQDGSDIKALFSDVSDKKYRITQSIPSQRSNYGIAFQTNKNYTQNRDIILDGINTSSSIEIPALSYIVLVTLKLRNTNQVHHIFYGTGTYATGEDNTNYNSKLTIDDYDKNHGFSGELYIPYKMNSREEELSYVLTATTSGIGPYWSKAGIGGGMSGYLNNCTGLTIAGGKIRVLAQNQNGATAIGGGGNGDAQLSITGGNVTAICSSTGTAIGGGIGWLNRGGNADINISGGTVYAENVGYYTRNSISYGGVSIGSGSSMNLNGNAANITISGGSVTAYARYGNGIGSGNSYQGTAAKATISISGNANVTTNALGGGTSKENKGGDAEITVTDSAIVNCVKYSEITDKWDTNTDNILNAYGIGGGSSAGSAKGGSAVVKVSGGTMNCNGGNIGGGNANGTGDGGDASIYVSGGTLNCASIGGGNSVSGKPGSVTSQTQKAGVVVTGGTLNTGTIGGGTNGNGDIGFATADISGGQIQGRFILANTDDKQNCFFHMSGGTIDNGALSRESDEATQKLGGAVYLSDPNGEVTISGGTIQNSNAYEGGAVYMTAGTFALSGTAEINSCKANTQGGAVYLKNGAVTMDGGCILDCKAKQGGAVYLESGTVTLTNGTIGKESSPNTADEGAGVYLAGGNLTVDGGSVMYNTAKNGAGAYLQDGSMTITNGQVLHNAADENGGGAYLAGGTLTVFGGVIQENSAAVNGGGAYLADGSLTLSGGQIDQNTAVDGAGAYLQKGNLTVSGSGGFYNNTASRNGGGAYLSGGSLTVESGTFNSNTATSDGGGAYLAGGTLTINGGSFGNNNATNGGGAYAADGKVRMFGGFVTGNHADEDGGGLYVSSVETAADIVLRSGSITNNTSGGNGGGIAVVGSDAKASLNDHVVLGLLKDHKISDYTTRSYAAFEYTDDTDSKLHNHASCPVLSGNTATGNGGGVYMSSSNAHLDVYCLEESNNKSIANEYGNSIMTEGGTVVIGDSGNNNENARGNTVIGSSMLVQGGTVDVYGNMENPLFQNNVLVDIKDANSRFEDHRVQASGDKKEYKVHYFENFKGEGDTATGIYKAIQYTEDVTISAEGSLFQHDGWKIIGWANETDKDTADKITYAIGAEIGKQNEHAAWGNDDTQPLKLYAVWKRTGYTVEFYPNAPTGTSVSGTMVKQQFEYNVEKQLTQNAYRIKGKRFNGWNTMADGTGTKYDGTYSDSKMTLIDGDTVKLYAQWVDCTHNGGAYPGTINYTLSDDHTTITETCDCGYTASVSISAVQSIYYDRKPHAATLGYNGSLLEGTPTITYQYRTEDTGAYGSMPAGETVPTSVGCYQASITLGNQTAYVEFQIKSATEGITMEAKATGGQVFADFNGTAAVSISLDDAFTVRFSVQNLTTTVYQTVPSLSFNSALPNGTTIIMVTNGSYWYCKTPAREIPLTSFTKMGGSESFTYDSTALAQTYQFIVDYSQADAAVGNRIVKLTYQPTGAEGELNDQVAVTTTAKADFGVTAGNSALTVTAPKQSAANRWSGKQLVLAMQASDGIPQDAVLTVTVGQSTTSYSMNARKQFIVPLTWQESQDVQLSLNSELASAAGKSYKLTAGLYAGAAGEKLMDTKASQNVTLTVMTAGEPSLKLTGTQRLLTNGQTLNLGVEMAGTDGCTVTANIQQKTGSGYSGSFLSASVNARENKFSLGGINASGSYRLIVTVSKNGQNLLEVPYYFIYQS